MIDRLQLIAHELRALLGQGRLNKLIQPAIKVRYVYLHVFGKLYVHIVGLIAPVVGVRVRTGSDSALAPDVLRDLHRHEDFGLKQRYRRLQV